MAILCENIFAGWFVKLHVVVDQLGLDYSLADADKSNFKSRLFGKSLATSFDESFLTYRYLQLEHHHNY